MSTHTVNATITVEITNTTAVDALAGGAGDERAKLESVVRSGLRELESVAQRYGLRITESSATVD